MNYIDKGRADTKDILCNQRHMVVVGAGQKAWLLLQMDKTGIHEAELEEVEDKRDGLQGRGMGRLLVGRLVAGEPCWFLQWAGLEAWA